MAYQYGTNGSRRDGRQVLRISHMRRDSSVVDAPARLMDQGVPIYTPALNAQKRHANGINTMKSRIDNMNPKPSMPNKSVLPTGMNSTTSTPNHINCPAAD